MDPGSILVEAAEVSAVVGGSDESWQGYVAAWMPIQDQLFRVALLMARSRVDAEDAVADAMAAAFTPWRRGRVASLEHYARAAVVHRIIGRGRRRTVADRYLQRRTGDDRGDVPLAELVVDQATLRDALAVLPPRQRAIIVLRYYAQLSVAETASTLGCAEGTVKSQTHDALAALRSRLTTEEG